MVRLTGILILFCILVPSPLKAQSIWLDPTPADNITLEAQKPLFSDSEGITFLTSSWQLSGRYGVFRGIELLGEIGISHFGQEVVLNGDLVLADFSETALTNVFLGIAFSPPIDGLSVTVGARLPTASDNAGGLAGIFTDPYRYEAHIIDYSSLMVELTYLLPITENVSIRGAGKPAVHFDHFDVGNIDRGGTDLSVRYALQGWYETEQLRGAVGVTGSASLLTGLHMGLFDSNVLAITTSLVGSLGSVEPGIIVQVPFTDAYSDVVDAVVGLSLTVPLP